MHLQSGTLLQGGKYRIEKVLGQGGFGITYLAVQTNLKNRKVAVKEFFLKEHCERDASTSYVSMGTSGSKDLVLKFKNKFIKEAETISEFRNHHIVTIFDVFEENGTAYYVMEYLPGGSLSERIPSDGLPESDAVGYIRQVCDALSYIHGRNILHLDIKPSNILFRKADEAVLIDFGISKHYDEAGGSQTSSTPVGISEGYAPTEQYEREGISSFSASTDIYSLGATLYCLLSGHRPPKASIVLNDGLPPLPSSVSSSTRAAVETAMSPKRKDRPQSVEDFLELLDTPVVTVSDEDTTVPGQDTGSSGHHNPRIKKWPWLMLAVVAAVLLLSLSIFRPFEPDDLSSDLSVYKEFLHLGDSLSMHEESLSESRSAYDSASFYEQKYSGSRYSRRFRGIASSKSASVQARIDSLRVSDSLAAIAAAEAAAARAEQERQDQERKKREAYERLKRSSSYNNGVLKVGSVEYPMVYVSGGSFDMGATSEQGSDAYSHEKPVHRVTLSSYSIGKYEVTQELWEAVMGNNPSEFKGARRPVEKVSWNDCQDFIRKLNELTGASFRLPTEAEWEFAARGGNSSRGYKCSGSDTIGDVAWHYGNSGDETHAVGGKSANELGLYDMSGNVSEWCSDWFGEYSSSSQTNPKGPGSGSFRVRRGGRWNGLAGYCRVSYRSYDTPDYRYNNVGLRLCH